MSQNGSKMNVSLSTLKDGQSFRGTGGKYTIISTEKGVYKCKLVKKKLEHLKEGSLVEFSGELNVKKVST